MASRPRRETAFAEASRYRSWQRSGGKRDRQGADVGTQYRSAIFFHTPEQEQAARQAIAALTASKLWDDPIVTEVTACTRFYPAEDYHRDYFARNPGQPYCRAVIAPKVAKARQKFFDKLKKQPE